jgi:hypothetical protein
MILLVEEPLMVVGDEVALGGLIGIKSLGMISLQVQEAPFKAQMEEEM